MTYKNMIKTIWSLPFLWNYVSALTRKTGVIVLMYHRIGNATGEFHGLDPDMFYKQMLWLKKHCRVIHPQDLIESSQYPSRTRPPVLVTFDDGYKDFYDRAYPVLHQLNIPAIVFLPTKIIDESSLLWTDQIHLAVFKTVKQQIKLPWVTTQIFSLRTKDERENCALICKSYLKNIDNKKRKCLLENLLIELDFSKNEQDSTRQMMNWDEIRSTVDLIDYGGHTHTHPIMSKIDRASLEFEIQTCHERILDEIGIAPKYFAYPNGRQEDFNSLSQQLLKKHGFEIAFTTISGINGPFTDWMAVSRLPTTTPTIADFAWLISFT